MMHFYLPPITTLPAFYSEVVPAMFLLVPSSGEKTEDTSPPYDKRAREPAYQAQQPERSASPYVRDENGPLISITSEGTALELSRTMAMLRARSQGIEKGYRGDPKLMAESYGGGTYSAVFAFPGTGKSGGVVNRGEAQPRAIPPVTDSTPTTGVPSSNPAQKRGSRPAWILVIPVEQTVDGKTLWGSKESEWSRAWVVPFRQDGMRLVSTQGDADDRDRLPIQLLENPDDPRTAQAARALARKYSAPAVALVRRSPTGYVSEWLWRMDGGSSNGDAQEGGDIPAARASSLQLLSDLAATSSKDVPEIAPDLAGTQRGGSMAYDDGDGGYRSPYSRGYDGVSPYASPFPQRESSENDD